MVRRDLQVRQEAPANQVNLDHQDKQERGANLDTLGFVALPVFAVVKA